MNSFFFSKTTSNDQSNLDQFKQKLPFNKSITKPEKPDNKPKVNPKNKPNNNNTNKSNTNWRQGQQCITKFIAVKPTAPAGDGKIPGHSLLISCWNVNGLRATLSKAHLQDYMAQRAPDILCLNETKIDKESLDRESNILTKWIPQGYTHYWNCSKLKKGYSGTAIITKYKPISVKYGIGDDKHDMEGRVITAEFERFFLVCVYVPNSGQYGDRLEYRLKEWDPAFGGYLKGLKQKKDVILTGDLNVAYGYIDIHETKGPAKFEAGFSLEERESFKRFLEGGWVDTFRELYPKRVKYSYWANWEGYRSENKGWRVDYFVVNQEAMKAVKDSMINCEIMGSDHCPVEMLYDPNFGIDQGDKIEEEKTSLAGEN